jgi:hypothetical protein
MSWALQELPKLFRFLTTAHDVKIGLPFHSGSANPVGVAIKIDDGKDSSAGTAFGTVLFCRL